jgi:hypothetical protein
VREANGGVAIARNQGLRLARAELVALLDADDAAYPDRLARQVAFMRENPSCGLLASACDVVDESGGRVGTYRPPADTGANRWALLTRNVIVTSTVLLRRSRILDVGGFDERLPVSEDYALWAKLAPMTHVAQLPEVLGAHRSSAVGLSATRQVEMRSLACEVSRTALSAAVGHDVGIEAVRCLSGGLDSGHASRAACRQAAEVTAEALSRMVTSDPAVRQCAGGSYRDWQAQMLGLVALAPSSLGDILLTSLGLCRRLEEGTTPIVPTIAWALHLAAMSAKVALIAQARRGVARPWPRGKERSWHGHTTAD